MTTWKIPLSDIDFGLEEAAAVHRVLASKWLSMGPEVASFEAEFAAMQGAKHAIAVSSATAALHLSFLALGIGKGDEVIQPALNFVAAANMTVACGAEPVFADIIDVVEPTIDPADVERLITPHTKAVVVMHHGGNVCRMAPLVEQCALRGIAIVEDACHAVGARYHDGQLAEGVMAGSIGDVGTFSFFANKNLVTGEGGMVVTNRDDLAAQIRSLRSHGMTSLTWDRHRGHARSYDVMNPGYNYRMDEIRAALGRVQLTKLEGGNTRRRNLLRIYRDQLADTGWRMSFADGVDGSAGHLMTALAPDAYKRKRAIAALDEAGIQSSFHYPCIADFRAHAQLPGNELVKSREFSTLAITLPLFPTLTSADVELICAIVVGRRANSSLFT